MAEPLMACLLCTAGQGKRRSGLVIDNSKWIYQFKIPVFLGGLIDREKIYTQEVSMSATKLPCHLLIDPGTL